MSYLDLNYKGYYVCTTFCVNLDIYKPVEKSWLNSHLHYKFQISTIEFQNISLKLKQCQIDNNKCKSSWVAMMLRIILLLNYTNIMLWKISHNDIWSFLSQRIALIPIICLVHHSRSKVKKRLMYVVGCVVRLLSTNIFIKVSKKRHQPWCCKLLRHFIVKLLFGSNFLLHIMPFEINNDDQPFSYFGILHIDLNFLQSTMINTN